MEKMPGFLAETREKLLGKGWGTTLILKANSQNVKQKFMQEGKISTEMLGLYCLHKAKKVLLIPVKQYVKVARKTLGMKKNNETRSPVTHFPYKSLSCVPVLKDNQTVGN